MRTYTFYSTCNVVTEILITVLHTGRDLAEDEFYIIISAVKAELRCRYCTGILRLNNKRSATDTVFS